jgi:hypothetical protein
VVEEAFPSEVNPPVGVEVAAANPDHGHRDVGQGRCSSDASGPADVPKTQQDFGDADEKLDEPPRSSAPGCRPRVADPARRRRGQLR